MEEETMTNKELETLIKKYFKEGPCPLDDSTALVFLTAYDNLLFLKQKNTNRLKELRKLVEDDKVSYTKKSNYRYESAHIYGIVPLIDEAISLAEKLTSYQEITYEKFMEAYLKVVKGLDF